MYLNHVQSSNYSGNKRRKCWKKRTLKERLNLDNPTESKDITYTMFEIMSRQPRGHEAFQFIFHKRKWCKTWIGRNILSIPYPNGPCLCLPIWRHLFQRNGYDDNLNQASTCYQFRILKYLLIFPTINHFFAQRAIGKNSPFHY